MQQMMHMLFMTPDLGGAPAKSNSLAARAASGHPAPMSRETINTICQSLPGATLTDPWGGGHDAWKIGGKMFASIGVKSAGVAVKCASIDDALHLQDLFGWPKAPYFHRSWVLIPLDTAEDELRHRIKTSYRLIRATLTKKPKPRCLRSNPSSGQINSRG